jgi:hypothetical protein
MSHVKTTETDLAKIVIEYLRDMKWEVWQEVAPFGGGNVRADIVAKQNNRIWVIECKQSLCLSALEQAFYWKQCAHYVSIATWDIRQRHRLFDTICSDYGLGHINVMRGHGHNICLPIQPKMNRVRNLSRFLEDYLVDKTQSYGEAGSNHSTYYTPFAETCRAIRGFVIENPGCTIKTMIDGIEHHYRSDKTARSCVLSWINKGVIDFITTDQSTYPFKLFLKESHDKSK